MYYFAQLLLAVNKNALCILDLVPVQTPYVYGLIIESKNLRSQWARL